MSAIYFLSYARPRSGEGDRDSLIRRFHEDLTRKIENKVRTSSLAEVGFRDAGSIESGVLDWEEELRRQLMARPIGIVLLSPQYLDEERPWCSWEFQYLHSRSVAVEKFCETRKRPPPRMLLLLNWVTPDERDLPKNFPKKVQQINESIVTDANQEDADAVASVTSRGIKDILELVIKQDRSASAEYERFMQCLASYIAKQFQRWEDVKCDAGTDTIFPNPPPLQASLSWEPAKVTNAARRPEARSKRLQKVYVVYIAAKPEYVEDTRAWRYKDGGESDWRAFAGPDDLNIAEPVEQYFDQLEGFRVEKWHFDYFREHMDELLTNEGRRAPLLLVIDPWTTAKLPKYREALAHYAQLESRKQVFSLPLVIWNESDPESKTIEREFAKHVFGLLPAQRWEKVESRDALADNIASEVKKLNNKIRNAIANELNAMESPPPRISAIL
ncbi:MAG TPA: hypothetical protein PKE61_02780 [Burkholderiaceae bacterium]|nr:hypothetical protein [Burkholderiaceae bacterium]HMZ56742.1 hypothetical protein [Nitrospira sp.]HNG55661.1 hypothetical protein [Nitrospira sp.]